MKIFSTLAIALVSFIGIAQSDFETRYFTISAESLPELEEIDPDFLSLKDEFSFKKKLASFGITQDNYWQPVNMMAAGEESDFVNDSEIEITPLNARIYGFVGFSGYNDDKLTKVRNKVYEEQRSPFLYNPYDPWRTRSSFRPYRRSPFHFSVQVDRNQ
ncbi:hypothetical protein MG296_13510 [Flavobacteriaceae bacterium TK19130]|nr:hypothetical protein [Thermobacterium salinum]